MRRRILGISALAAAAGLGGLPGPARAQGGAAALTRPVTLVVPYPPGAVTDLVARLLQQHMREGLGQPVVIENRGGGGGTAGTAYVARSRPDGYTLLLTVNPPIVTSPFITKGLTYEPGRDLTGVTLVGETYLALVVRPNSPFRTVADIVAEAKRRPGEISYGSAGVGSSHHISGELLALNAGIRLNHIPYQGGAPAVQAALAGQIDMSFGTLPAVMPFVQRGDLRIVALAEPRRFREMPDIPTIAETVPGVETTTWLGLLAPNGTPREMVERLHQAAVEALSNPQSQATLAAAGFVPVLAGPDAFNRRIAADLGFWGEAIRRIGLTID